MTPVRVLFFGGFVWTDNLFTKSMVLCLSRWFKHRFETKPPSQLPWVARSQSLVPWYGSVSHWLNREGGLMSLLKTTKRTMLWSATAAILWFLDKDACGTIARSAFNSLAWAAHFHSTAKRFCRQGAWGSATTCMAVFRGSTAMSVSFSGQVDARPALKHLGKDAIISYQSDGRERPGHDSPTEWCVWQLWDPSWRWSAKLNYWLLTSISL
jgi:hypothetical protein